MKKRNPLFRKKNIRKKVRRRRIRYVLRGMLVLGLLVAMGWGAGEFLSRLELFSLKKIEVQGELKKFRSEDIVRLSGVKKGVNLFNIDLTQVRGRFKDVDFIKNISVHRQLPHTLVLKVAENFPVFVLSTSGRFYYLDSEGKIFKDITETLDGRDLPVLSGISEELILMEPDQVKKITKNAVRLKQAYVQTPFHSLFGLSEIHFEKNIGFILYPEKKKYSIKFGTVDFPEKMKKLSEVWTQLQDSKVKISSIDLNYPGKVLMTL